MLVQVRSGVSLSAALETVDGFQRKLCSSIAVGEETGRLDSMLDSIADSMEYDAQQASKRMMTILEPMLIVLMAFVVGFIIIAVMSPIIGSYSAIESSRERIISETCKPHKRRNENEHNRFGAAGGAGACRGRQVRRAAFRAGALQCPHTAAAWKTGRRR